MPKMKDLATEALQCFFEQYQSLDYIGGFKNEVYAFSQLEEAYILRLTMERHRHENDLLKELEWIHYLYEQGVPLSLPVRSIHGKWTESFWWNEQKVTATVFKRAKGASLSYPEYLGNLKVFEKLGEITGKMHQVTTTYHPQEGKRFSKSDARYMDMLTNMIPKNHPYLRDALNRVMEEMKTLDITGEHYGLIHGDINVGNFFVCDDEITLFDFDECHYSWYVEDIAIQLYYTVYVMLDDDVNAREDMARSFMQAFMKGYQKEKSIDNQVFQKISLFLKLREIIVHIGLQHSWDLTQLTSWRKGYFEQSQSRILRGVPIVSLDNF